MFIELPEILICPACRTESDRAIVSGLVAVVEELNDRRVRAGWLGCPVCQTKYRVEETAVHFGPARPWVTFEEPGLGLKAAALLALHERSGYVVIGQGLESIAHELSGSGAALELIGLAAGAATGTGEFSRLVGVLDPVLPLRSGTVVGVVLLDAEPESIGEAARVLEPAGRLVVFQPARMTDTGQVEAALGAAGLAPLAVEAEAIVAVRPA